MEKHDRHSSLVCLILALLVGIEAIRTLPLGSWQNPGPGFLPIGAAFFMALFSLIAFLQANLGRSSKAGESLFPKERWKNITWVLAALFGYTALVEFLGFLATTFFLLILLFRAMEPQKWVWTLGGSFLGSLIFYVLFEMGLKTRLPKGVLGF